VLRPERYSELLGQLGFREQCVRLEVYAHHLASRAEVVEWMKGTVLTAYGERLSATSYARFCAVYAERLLATLEDRRPYFWPFPRILLSAVLDE
jgi:trans-aconitate 2-methyltransferase